MGELIWFGGWVVAVICLFAGALRLPQWVQRYRSRTLRVGVSILSLVAVGSLAVFASVALTRHDAHFDLTRERVFTPDPDALEVVERLQSPVQLTYFFREDDPAGRRAQHIVELMARHNVNLQVATVDPDKYPSRARGGDRLSNAALLEGMGRRVIVHSTDETDIAIGIQRLLRERVVTICFMRGHGEYSSDNFEFHTHVEGAGSGGQDHSHGGESAVVQTSEHGVGRFRRSLEALGYAAREITPAIDGEISSNCNVVIDAGPRTPYTTVESTALEAYLQAGGATLLMYDLGFEFAPAHQALLNRIGVRLSNALVVDPKLHYARDPENVAITAYGTHPITDRLSFTFYPGVRAIDRVQTKSDAKVTELILSSNESFRRASGRHAADHSHGQQLDRQPGAQLLGAAIEGKLAPSVLQFRAVVVGDSDFASNSFFPYMANNRIAIAMVQWLSREEERTSIKPRIPVQESIELTNRQQNVLLLLLVVVLPLVVALVGVLVWWRRRI